MPSVIRLNLKSALVAAGMAAGLLGPAAQAQGPAPSRRASNEPVIEYSRNESGGRITLSFPGADSVALEGQRLRLLELVAAIRRGDFRTVWVIPNSHPAVQVLAEHRTQLRCTYRSTHRGAELVLLSDDDGVVAAIHQILSVSPPRALRL